MKRILIVDDDLAILDVLKIILEDKGYEIDVLEHGGKIVEKIESYKPHLILLDNWLPDITGSEIIRKMKAEEKTRRIPVVIISANQDLRKITRDSGADGSLAKPFNIEDLLSTVNKFVPQFS